MYVVADFAKINSISDYEKIVQDKFSDIDIGILILNAGEREMGPFSEIENKDVEKMVNVNALHIIYFAKAMMNNLL